MINLYGVLQEQETINGELGLGVDYYKGEKGDTPIKGVDYLTPDDVKEISDKVLEKVEAGTKGEDGKSAYQIAVDEGFEGSETEWLASLKGKTPVKGVDYFTTAEINEIEEGAAAKVDLSNYAKTADLSTVATSGSYNDLSNKPSIPSTTGLASTNYVDDKIAAIVIPTVPTKVSAFENDKGYLTEHQSLTEYAKKTEIPAPYTLPTASTSTLGGVKVDGNTITITDGIISAKSGSGGSEPNAYIKDASVSGNTLTLTKKDDTEVVFAPSGGFDSSNSYIIKERDRSDIPDWVPDWCANPDKYPVWIKSVDNVTYNQVIATWKYSFTSPNNYIFRVYWMDNLLDFYSCTFYFTDSNFTTVKERTSGRSEGIILNSNNYSQYITNWQYTQDQNDSNLYNAKELVVYVENTHGNNQMGYFNFGESNLGNFSNYNFYFDYDTSSPYISYDGSSLTCGQVNNSFYIYYKT